MPSSERGDVEKGGVGRMPLSERPGEKKFFSFFFLSFFIFEDPRKEARPSAWLVHPQIVAISRFPCNCTEIEKWLVSERWGCGYIGTLDSEIKCAQSLNQMQTLKDCFFHHVYCAHLGTPWHRAVTASCAAYYRESRYTRTHHGCDLESLRVYFFLWYL